jgi:hypothetical protein
MEQNGNENQQKKSAILSQVPKGEDDAQQVIGREGETATLLSTGLFNSKLREFGFAPRQFNRWVLSCAV